MTRKDFDRLCPAPEFVRVDADEAARFLKQTRRDLLHLRKEMEITRRPDIVQDYIDCARLSITLAKRGLIIY